MKQNERLKKVAERFESKLQKIDVVLFDVDGVLTDGKVFYDGEEIGFNRHFYVPDGYGMKVLKQAGLKIGILSGGDSLGVRKRFELLNVDFMFLGNEDKRYAVTALEKEHGLLPDQLLYMGDELFDIPVLEVAGFSATVPHACDEVKTIVDYVSELPGGKGAVREVIDVLRYAQGIVPDIPRITT